MTRQGSASPPLNPAWGWLLGGIALQLVSNGRWIVGPAAWLAPVGWLVFLDRTPPRVGGPAAFSLFMLVEFIAWRGLVPAPGMLYYLIVGAYATVYFVPFLLHTLLAPRVGGFAATLIFPSAWVGLEFAFQRWVTPYGSWFSLAYTQTDFLPLMQLAAFAGTPGISFLITWFASTSACSIERGGWTREGGRLALRYGLVLAACITLGEVRLARRPTDVDLVRVGGVVPSPVLSRGLELALTPVRRGQAIDADRLAAITAAAERLNDDLFSRTVREARAGARVVAWSETAGRVLEADEERFLDRARGIARAEQVVLLLAYGVWIPDAEPPFENKVVAVSHAGDVVWEFRKAHPVAGSESPFLRAGDGVVHALRTSFGAVSALICHDLDFPVLGRQANRLGVGLMVGPSADWPAITPLHAKMAALRAIEGGFSLLRPTSGGRSVAVDSRGRSVMSVDYAEDAVVAQVPVVSVSTVYAAVGDWFAWLCLGAIVAVSLQSGRRGSRSRMPEDP